MWLVIELHIFVKQWQGFITFDIVLGRIFLWHFIETESLMLVGEMVHK